MCSTSWQLEFYLGFCKTLRCEPIPPCLVKILGRRMRTAMPGIITKHLNEEISSEAVVSCNVTAREPLNQLSQGHRTLYWVIMFRQGTCKNIYSIITAIQGAENGI
jgi:hypothetical protein